MDPSAQFQRKFKLFCAETTKYLQKLMDIFEEDNLNNEFVDPPSISKKSK